MITRHSLPAGSGAVALTFDDCDRGDAWTQILDGLADQGVPATFFALGMRVEQFPEPAKRTVADGHGVGSHGWDHSDFTELTGAQLEGQLRAGRRAWRQAGAEDVTLLRPPYGRYDAGTLAAARRAGYGQMVLWDVDPLDWQLPDPETVVARVLGACPPGSIVDLHVTEPTAAALPEIVAGLRRKGLACVAL
ncbi:MAG: polysaccharide deacetylase family protein [Actinomycetota bacterium]|nr:polysaccharide deacetylase family protein [Actinomycetota bacterium]